MSDPLDVQLADALIREYGQKEAQKQLALMAGYIDVPPTITEFIDDTHFAGKFFGKKLYPVWRQTLQEVFPNPFYSPYLTVAMTGSTRYGKTTACLAGLLYDLVKLLYLKDPHTQFGIIPTSLIVIAFVNTTKNLSDSVLYSQFDEMIEMSPFFSDKRVGLKKGQYLPSKITPVNGSTSEHYLGTGVVSAILSELNFQKRLRNQALNNFNQIKTRMQGTYGRGDSYITPGRLWMDSSKTDEAGFMETQLVSLRGDPKALVVEKALWEVLGTSGKMEYSGETFKVFVGDSNRDPFILEGPGASLNIPETLVIDVPIEYRQNFEDNIYIALRDLAGKSTWSAHKFFPNIAPVKNALCLENPVYKEVVDLDFHNEDRLINFIDMKKIDMHNLYFFHIDVGIIFDRTGIAGTKNTGVVSIERIDKESGLSFVHEEFQFQTDIVIPVVPRPGKEVPLYKLKQFFPDLRRAGVRIGGISVDGHQSVNMVQDLTLLGFPAEVISVDRSREPYDSWHDAVVEGRWIGPEHPILEKEMLALLDMVKKIDHPLDNTKLGQVNQDRPSKDLSDAVCGSHWNCKNNGTVGIRTMNSLQAFVEFAAKDKEKPKSVRDQIEEQWQKNQKCNEFY